MILIYLQVENLSYGFEKSNLFDDLSFSMEKGELLSIIGPSGEGKTTLLKVLSGLITNYTGSIFINSKSIDDSPSNQRECLLVGSSTPLFEHMTVFENIAFGLRLRKIDKKTIADKVNNLIAKIGLEALSARKPKQISQGQYQRILLARALVLNPKLVLLDEPLSNIDPNLKIEFRQQVLDMLRQSNTTAIMVTHDMEDAFYMSNRVAVLLKKGLHMLQNNGKPESANALVENYLSGLKLIEGEVRGNVFRAHSVEFQTNMEDGRYRLLCSNDKLVLLNKIGNSDYILEN